MFGFHVGFWKCICDGLLFVVDDEGSRCMVSYVQDEFCHISFLGCFAGGGFVGKI